MMPDPCATSPPAPPRRRPSPQSLVALASLACLLAIAGGLLAVQSRLNPAVANFLAISAGGPGTGPAAVSADEPPLIPFAEGMSALTPVERFTPETLSDKIDGKAELYLSAGVIGLACQRVGLAGPPGTWVEAFVFDMGSGENAFAVFSVQRRPDAEPLELAQFAYRAGNALFFVHGAAYVELIGSEESATVVAALTALARGLIGSAPAPTAAMAERDLFPGDGLVAESIRLIPADAFGLAGFDRVYTAAYRLGPAEMTAFLARRSSAAEAAAAAAAYAGFLKAYGGTVLGTDQPVAGGTTISIMDAVEVVFAAGDFVAGVHEAPDADQAVALARRMASQLSEVPSAR